MIVLWLLISHLVGDYLLQTRWQAAGKFGWSLRAVSLRAAHVYWYTLAFTPVVWVYHGDDWWAVVFLGLLALLHFLTDAQRFLSTPGEWLAWKLGAVDDVTKIEAHTRPNAAFAYAVFAPSKADGLRIPPNPWPSIPLAIDQTLHLIQIAVLAQVFLT